MIRRESDDCKSSDFSLSLDSVFSILFAIDKPYTIVRGQIMAAPQVIKFEPQVQKFKELLLYISEKCAHDRRFGAVKLNKILFFSDFIAYAQLGNPISGFEYQKLQNGPAPRNLVQIRKQMENDRELALQEVPLKSGKIQKRTVNLRRPNLNLFSAEEIALVDRVVTVLSDKYAEEVSDLSHREVGWKVVAMNETIPYETAFISDEPLTPIEIQRGRELARQFDLMA